MDLFSTVDRCGMRTLDGYGLYMSQLMFCKVDRRPARCVECVWGVTKGPQSQWQASSVDRLTLTVPKSCAQACTRWFLCIHIASKLAQCGLGNFEHVFGCPPSMRRPARPCGLIFFPPLPFLPFLPSLSFLPSFLQFKVAFVQGPTHSLAQPPGDTPQRDPAPSRPACCFLGYSLTPCCRMAGQDSPACVGSWEQNILARRQFVFISALRSPLATPPNVIQPRHARRAAFSDIL